GVDPDVAVRDLHTLRPRRRATRVINGGGGVLGRLPRFGFAVERQELRVGLRTDHEAVLPLYVDEGVVELRIDEEHGRTRVLDDVADLFGVEPEVDRHEDAAEPAHAPEGGEKAGGVLGHHGHALARPGPEAIQAGGLGTSQRGKAGVRHRLARRSGLVGLVDDSHTAAVDELGALDEVVDGQRNLHGGTPPLLAAVAPIRTRAYALA